MPLSFAIREAALGDIERCTQLARLAAPERPGRGWADSLRRDVEQPTRLLVVAEAADRIVGYGRARLFEPAANAPADSAPGGYYLIGLFVQPDRRQRGVGTALTRARLDWIAERATEAWCFANARNTASIALHRRFGFEEVSRRFSFPNVAFDGGEGVLFRVAL